MHVDEVDLLQSLIEFYSPTYHEADAVQYLVSQMQGLGFDAFIDQAGNAVGTRGDGENEILLLGHVDTVPGAIQVRRDGDLLFGRGSVDAKGPLACFTAAAAQILPPPGWRVTVIGAVAEEGDLRGAVFLRSRTPPQALVIGEPSKWDKITLGYKGSLWVDYSIHRPVSHIASNSETATEAAVGYWNQVNTWCGHRNAGNPKLFNQVTPTLHGMGSNTDGFYEDAWVKINLRLPPTITVEQVTAQLEACKGDGDLKLGEGIDAYRAEKNTPLVRGFLAAIRAEGGEPAFTLKTGTSDMNIVAPVWQCPTVAYGPGDSSLDHTPFEHISLDEYRKSIRMVARVLEHVGSLYKGFG